MYMYNTIHMYSGITSGRVLNGECWHRGFLWLLISARRG